MISFNLNYLDTKKMLAGFNVPKYNISWNLLQVHVNFRYYNYDKMSNEDEPLSKKIKTGEQEIR